MMRRTAKQQGNENLRVPSPVEIIPLTGMPEIVPGDDLAGIIVEAVARRSLSIEHGNIFVVAQKIVSKSEGKIVKLDSIAPSKRAVRWAAKHQKDARVIELALRQAKRIVRMSNTAKGTAVLLPEDPDRSARRLKAKLTKQLGVSVAVLISDTFGRPWREGLVNVALGVAGIGALMDYRGKRDASGKALQATMIAVADELASAAELVMGKSNEIPVAVIRGVALPQRLGSGHDLIRPVERDLFR